MNILILLSVFVMCYSKDSEYIDNPNIISCHTTDFICFKKQFKALRDNYLQGSRELKIEQYQPYVISYGDTGTCVRFTGVEDSELVAISMDCRINEFSISLELPIRVQQVNGAGLLCAHPDNDFTDVPPHDDKLSNPTGALMKFAGNATVTVSYPYELQRKKSRLHLVLGEENVDVTLDMPDLSQHDKESPLEAKLYAWSEWAYRMVQHVDIAQHVLTPFTGQLRRVTAALPIARLLLLYPDEEYANLRFSFVDASVDIEKKR